MTPKYQISLFLLAMCFSRATLCMEIESVLHPADLNPGKETNAELESAGSSLTRHVDNSDKEEYGDNYISTLLHPREKRGLARDQVKYPDSKQGKKALLKILDEDYKSMKSDLQRLATTTQHEIDIRGHTSKAEMDLNELRRLMELISRIDSVQTQLWTPMRDRLHRIVGKHLTFVGTHNDGDFEKPRECEGIDHQRIQSTKKISEAEHETQMETLKHSNSKQIPKETFLQGDPFQLVMDRLNRDSFQELEKCRDYGYVTRFRSINVDVTRMIYVTVHSMYKHELINLQVYRSFFQRPDIVEKYATNMVEHFSARRKNKWLPLDRDSIVSSHDSEVDRSIFEALDANTQRIASLSSVKAAFEIYRDSPTLNKGFRSYCSNSCIFMEFSLPYIKLPTGDPTTFIARNGANEIVFKESLSDFNNIDWFGSSSKKRQNLKLVLSFRVLQLYLENDHVEGMHVYPTDSSFKKKYSLVSESVQFLRDIGNIKLYLRKSFPQSHRKNLKIDEVHSTKKVPSPLQELKLISKHITKIDSAHQKAIKQILDGDSLNAYCQHEHIRYVLRSLRNHLRFLRIKHCILR
ncbi:hypothetical protein PSTG_03948 [Puccinia striiformis f. sp. tritici PST-78]|uniref:SUN domain-containing protein n=1 Tax=Puccinia striiformis f. sp. tritici PST-78 TaxID=1165861 RepID=A0A0L0VUP4_9BASI|nr:hypothetical protein PSTG_03948 [Puccinia striiformis f. sp. tritici PST-78]